MPLPPELELVDQLLGGSMPLPLVCDLFDSEARARIVLNASVSCGAIVLIDDGGNLPDWRSQEVLRSCQPLREHRTLRVALTDKGAKAFETGYWDRS